MWLVPGCAIHSNQVSPSGPTPSVRPDAGVVDARRRTEFDASQNAWHGTSAKELRARLGVPTRTAAMRDGSQVLSYTKSGQIHADRGMELFSCTVNYVLRGTPPVVVAHSIDGC